mgnify:CR=1 FL=1
MKKIKNNKIVNLKDKNEYEKTMILGEISKKINLIFKENKKIIKYK